MYGKKEEKNTLKKSKTRKNEKKNMLNVVNRHLHICCLVYNIYARVKWKIKICTLYDSSHAAI